MTLNGVKKRLEKLENNKEEEDILILYEDCGTGDPRQYPGYWLTRCKQACDENAYQRALEEAFVNVTGKNPYKATGIQFATLTKEIALEVVRILREKGIAVNIDDTAI